jgi:RNA polymerase sigma-70 factor, ECF subfamily
MPENSAEQWPDVDSLVVAARSDREAFGRLYGLYYDRIFRYCQRLLYDRCAAEDATSDAFMFVARKMRLFRGTTEHDFRRWLYRIATTECHALVRRSKRRQELWGQVVQQRLLEAQESADRAKSCDALDWSHVHEAMVGLSPREQAIVTLRLFEDLSYGDIAPIVGIRVGTARVVYSRALEKLRDLYSSRQREANDRAVRRT